MDNKDTKSFDTRTSNMRQSAQWIHDFIERHDRQTADFPKWLLHANDAPVE